VKVIVVDMHAEATSEKQAMGWFLDGKVSAVLGTHTHVAKRLTITCFPAAPLTSRMWG
jgi:calcineurin-like phosphoesterase